MTKARVWSLAEPNVPTEFEGQRILTAVRQGQDPPSRWDVLRRIIRQARKTGYASATVDQAFLYVAIYDPKELDKDGAGARVSQLPEDLLRSGILFEQQRERNSLMLNVIPLPEPGGPQLFQPYYLYSLPRRAIFDMLHGRLLLMNLLNPGRIAEALEREGFSVTVSSGETGFSKDPIVVSTTFSDDEGNMYRGEMHQLQQHLYEMVMEFLPLSYLIEVARAMREAMRHAAIANARG